MNDFKKYIEDAKSQLDCNASENYKKQHVTYLYTNEQVDEHLEYFEKCMGSGLSAYKALLFFGDYINGDYSI